MPLILNEDESKKLGQRHLILPQNLVDHLTQQANLYSDKQYHQSKGFKRLKGLLNKDYNDVKGNKKKNHNEHTLTFPEAKRMDFDISLMVQSNENPEYEMIGGDMMRDWLHNAIASMRNSVREVGAVPEVPKLEKKDVKPKDIKKEIKVGGTEIQLENKDFNDKITQIF